MVDLAKKNKKFERHCSVHVHQGMFRIISSIKPCQSGCFLLAAFPAEKFLKKSEISPCRKTLNRLQGNEIC
jgi:hypothetical protein